MLAFEDVVVELPEGEMPPDEHKLPIMVTWTLPPLPNGPDLLVLATELAGIGGPDLPLEVSAVDVFASVTDSAERSLNIAARTEVSLARIYMAEEHLGDTFLRAHRVSGIPARASARLARRALEMSGSVALPALQFYTQTNARRIAAGPVIVRADRPARTHHDGTRTRCTFHHTGVFGVQSSRPKKS